jgi:hypothetical protein
VELEVGSVCMIARGFQWKMMALGLALTLLGVLLLFETIDMLFQMNPLSLVAIVVAAVFLLSGIVLLVVSLASTALT